MSRLTVEYECGCTHTGTYKDGVPASCGTHQLPVINRNTQQAVSPPAGPAKAEAVDREAGETTAAGPFVPDWHEVHKGSAHLLKGDEQDLFPITRETLRHARSALRQINADDYCHNNGAAEREIIDALEHWNSHPIERAQQPKRRRK